MTSWEVIVARYGRMVFHIAWRILGHYADTEDVVQEVFLEAHRLRSQETIRHWPGLLRRLATCRALDRLRQRRPIVSMNAYRLVSDDDEPIENLISDELEERLRQSIAELPEREASVFCLRYFDQLTNKEIAETLNISEGAVAVALHKARTKLENYLLSEPRP